MSQVLIVIQLQGCTTNQDSTDLYFRAVIPELFEVFCFFFCHGDSLPRNAYLSSCRIIVNVIRAGVVRLYYTALLAVCQVVGNYAPNFVSATRMTSLVNSVDTVVSRPSA